MVTRGFGFVLAGFSCLFLVLPVRVAGADKKFPALGDVHHSDKSYRLVWQEEFTGTKLDRKKWVAEDDAKIGQYGHGNGESKLIWMPRGIPFLSGMVS